MQKSTENVEAYLAGKLSYCMAADDAGDIKFILTNEEKEEQISLAFNEDQAVALLKALQKAMVMFSEKNDGYIIMD